ncbi:response regulator [Glaciimonas sp. GG7]
MISTSFTDNDADTPNDDINDDINDICNVIVADDHPIILHGVAKMLDSDESIRIVATAATVSNTFKALSLYECDILICDYSFYGDSLPDGLPMIKKIREMYPDMKIIVLSAREDFATAQTALESGVHGFIRKNSDMKNVLFAVQEVRIGNQFMDHATAEGIYKHMVATGRDPHSPITQIKLSSMEMENIRMLKRGLSLTEIASLTKRSVKTVSSQKQTLMKKLGSKNNMEFFIAISNEHLIIDT